MKDDLIKESVADYGYFEKLRDNYGYTPTVSITNDWTASGARSAAEDSSARDTGFFNSYPFFMLDADARTTFMINMNEGQLMDDKDRMISSTRDKERAEALINIISGLDPERQDVASIVASDKNYVSLAKDGKFDSDDINKNLQKLQEIKSAAEEEYQKAFEDYQTDLNDVKEWKESHSVSEYYTRKSRQKSKIGNWFYTQPATQGLSSSSWKEQVSSTVAGFASSVAINAAAGAAMGSVVPGAGTATGGAVGALKGAGQWLVKKLASGIGAAIVAQLSGGAAAREQESHMEAYSAYQDKLLDTISQKGLNISDIANNLREQAKHYGYDGLDEITDQDLITIAAADDRFKFDFEGGYDLTQAMDDAYIGTRRVYERNNALGAAEFATDIFMFSPVKFIGATKAGGKLAKGLSKANPLNYLQNVTMKTNLDISKLAGQMRLRALMKYGKGILQRTGLNFIEEGTEEGAQGIIQSEFAQGKYDNEQAEDSLIDAIFSGNIISDMADNLLFRTQSGAAFLGLNSKYKNDLQLQEEMWSGGLLSLLSPQSSGMIAKNFYDTYKGVKQAYGMGKFIEESLQENADINGIENFYRNMRKYKFANENDYKQVLEFLREELKSAKTSSDGHTTRKWKLDTDALHKIIGPVNKNLLDEEGKPIEPQDGELTDEHIDQYIDIQSTIAKNLFENKKDVDASWKRIKSGFEAVTPIDGHTTDELNALKNEIAQVQEDIEDNKGNLLQQMRLKHKLNELKNKYKSYSKRAIDTEMQDAYYALTAMGKAQLFARKSTLEDANKIANSIKSKIHSSMDGEALKKALKISSVDSDFLFDVLYNNQSLRNLRTSRAKMEADFLASQRSALNGNSPIELSRTQRNALERLDTLIKEAEELHKLYMSSLDSGLLQVDENEKDTLRDIIKYGNSSAAQFVTTDAKEAYMKGLSAVFENSSLSPEDMNEYVETRDEAIAARLLYLQNKNELDTLLHGKPEEVKELLKAYKDAKKHSFESQQAAEKESLTNQQSNQEKYSSIRKWLIEATPKQIGERVDELDSNLTAVINSFENLTASLQNGTTLKTALSKALEYANALQSAANGSKITKVRALQYQLSDLRKQLDGDNSPEAEKALEIINQMLQNIIDTNIINEEVEARQHEYSIPGKYLFKGKNPLKVDNKTFVDDEGNMYNVDIANSRYSENNGLVLRLIQVNPNRQLLKDKLQKDADRIKSIILGLDEEIKQLETELFHGIGSENTLEALHNLRQEASKALTETMQALKNVDVNRILDVKYGDELLDKLYYQNNDGSKTTLNQSYKTTNDTISEQIKTERSRRLHNPGIHAVSYRNVSSITAKQISREIGDLEQQNEESEIKRAIAYSLGDSNNKKAASVLGSPYYQAKYWSGFFAYTMDETEVDSWKTVSDIRKRSIKRSIKQFNKLVKQIAYLKSVNRLDLLTKFLNDTDALLQVPVDKQSNNDTVTLESADPARPEYAVQLTRQDIMEIIRFLPMKAYLRNPRYGSGEKQGKLYIPLVLADLKDESNAYSEDGKFTTKFQWRYAMVKSFLQESHLRKDSKKPAENEQEQRDKDDENALFDTSTGFDSSAEQQNIRGRKQKPYATTIHIKQGSVEITFEKYNQKFESPQFNPESPVFYDVSGQRLASLPDSEILSVKQLTEMYQQKVQDALSSRNLDALYDQFGKLLTELLNNGTTITKEQLSQIDDETGLTVLEQIILDGVRYGDGLILRNSFASTTIGNKLFGGVKYQSTDTKLQSIEKSNKVDRLFELIQDEFYNLFLSHNNPNLQKGTKQMVTPEQIDSYINSGRFTKAGDKKTNKAGSVQILILDDDGEWRTLGSNRNPVRTSSQKIAELLNKLEQEIDAVNTPEQFFDKLNELGTISFEFSPSPTGTYTKEEKQAFAIDLISKYIRNRRFGRLKNVSSLIDMLLSGTDHPNNDEVQTQRFFAQKGKVINSNLDEIDCLHIKEVNGVYYFDLVDFASKSVYGVKENASGVEEVITDLELQQEHIEETKQQVVTTLSNKLDEIWNNGGKRTDLLKFMNENSDLYRQYKAFEGLYDENVPGFVLRYDNGDEIVNDTEFFLAVTDIIKNLKEEFDGLKEQVATRLVETLQEQASAEEQTTFFEDGKHARVQFAVGSYNEKTGKARILRSDGSGNLIAMNEAQGQPGGVYLIIPSFMNSSGKRRIVHLNGRKLAIHQATMIARLLDAVRTGKLAYNGNIPSDIIPGFNIQTDSTVNQLLEQLIHIGTKSIENDSSASAFANLLFVDDAGQIHFGSNVLNDTNLNELIQFLQERKQIRVDRSKLLNDNASVGIDASIELTEDSEFLKGGIVKDKSVFALKADENYQHYVINSGVIRSDLNPDKGARMYNGVVCAIDTPFTGNDAIPNPGNTNNPNSAASARQQATNFVTTQQFQNNVNAPEQPTISQPINHPINQQQMQQPIVQSTNIEYTVESVNQFIIDAIGSNYQTIYVSNKEVTVDDVLEAIQFLQVKQKPDGTLYKAYSISVEKTNGKIVKVKFPLRNETPAPIVNQPVQIQNNNIPVQQNPIIPQASVQNQPIVPIQNQTIMPVQAPVPVQAPIQQPNTQQPNIQLGLGPSTQQSQPAQIQNAQPVPSVNASQQPTQQPVTVTPQSTEIDVLKNLIVEVKSKLGHYAKLSNLEDNMSALKAIMFQVGREKGMFGSYAEIVQFNSTFDNHPELTAELYTQFSSIRRTIGPNYGKAVEFLDKHVEKEDYKTAQARAIRMLGNPQIKFTTDLPFTFDTNRRAYVYVYGQCAESFMTIYRSSNGQIAAGTMDHEAFHRISLFVLSKRERKALYNEIRNTYSETKNMTDQQIEEFAADLFKDFVNSQIKQGVTDFYSKNSFVKFFQKLYDSGIKLMHKLFGLRSNPNYRGVDKLFKDMYSGRYAYAKATKENIELFNMVYRTNPLSGIKSPNGTIIARTASERNQILRTILSKVVNDSKLLDTVHNYIDIDTVLDQVKTDLQQDNDGLEQRIVEATVSGDIDNIVRFLNLKSIYDTILNDAAWAEWKKIINNTLRRQFKISAERRDPNQVLEAQEDNETEEMYYTPDDGSEQVEDGSEQMPDDNSRDFTVYEMSDTLQRNMWNSAALSVKLMFYAITDNTVRNNKYNSNGMLNYANPGQLYIKFTELLQDCISEEEMLYVLDKNKDQADVASVLEFLTQSKDPTVNKSLQNKFFTSVCRYQHNFENNVYEIEEKTDIVDGVSVQRTEVNARSVSGNVNEITEKARTVIMKSISDALASRGINYGAENKYDAKQAKDAIAKAILLLKNSEVNKEATRQKVLNLLTLHYHYNGFGMFVDGDSDLKQSTDMLMSLIWDNNSNKVNKVERDSICSVMSIVNDNFTSITPESINNDETSINSRIQKIVDENKQLQAFLKAIGKYSPRSARTMSQNGPKNVRIYTIGAYNTISRLFKLWIKPHFSKETNSIKNTNWKEYQLRNPYVEHSVWLRNKELSNSKMNTRLQTMTEGDYENAKSDKFAFAGEEYMNRMVTVLGMDDKGNWLGNHAFPVLANKKFSADLQGVKVEGLDQVATIVPTASEHALVFNTGAKKVFAGYFLDELNAMQQARETRDNFIATINEVLGENYTVDSFSDLSVSDQRLVLNAIKLPAENRADAVYKINEALKTLVITYHFKSSKTEPAYDQKGRVVSFNDSHIDLRKGAGYKHRHFQKVADKLGDYVPQDVNDKQLWDAIVSEVFTPNVQFVERDMRRLQIYHNIPKNLIEQFSIKNKVPKEDVVKLMIATFTIRHMSDILEFEKLVQGDMAYYGAGGKNYRSSMDKMTKRYSGPVSTFGLNASTGTQHMSLTVDAHLDLTDATTYNALTIQTTKLIDYDVYEGLVNKSLNIPVTIEYSINSDNDGVDASIDYKQLLDEDGKLKKEVLQGVFKEYAQFIEKYGDEVVARSIVTDVLNRYAGYLSQDYTDATTFISSSMFRELRQRSDDGWTETEEACYLFMEHYHELYKFHDNETSDWDVIQRAATVLGIDKETLDYFVITSRMLYGDKYTHNIPELYFSKEQREQRARYRGHILSYLENEDGTPKIDTTALKYIHYGNKPQVGDKTLYIPVYDKTALAPLFRIFTEDHGAEDLYKLTQARNIHVIKYDSSTKSGGMFGYQLYDVNGDFNLDLYRAPVAEQWFDQLSKQLDTDMHTHNDASLLTQLTKVIMLNTVDQNYTFGKENISGKDINAIYSAVFNSLTKEGFNKFVNGFGFEKNGELTAEGRVKLVKKLREVLEESGASQTVIDAFELDENGEFVTNPALLPSVNQMQSRLLSQIGKIIVDTHIKGIPLYQIVSAGYDKDHPLKKRIKASYDKELLSPGDIDENGNVVTRMQCRISIMLFNDVINKAKKNKALLKKYNGLTNFEDKRRFILDNKEEVVSIAYRVPTQGQNSTIAIDIVDVLPSTQGGIIQLPTTLTALTGADFDIDKLFTATYNYEITDHGIQRVNYRDKYNDISDLIAHMDELSIEQKENLLLDIYQTVLTSNSNFLHTTTPLDVCTAPVKRIMTKEIKDFTEKNNADAFSLSPAHQVQMRVQNSGSDSTIGPMALNSVFQYYTQTCDLGFIEDPQLKKIGITGFGMEYLRTIENQGSGDPTLRIQYILDITSAMINAAVDAAKDNYIGRSNINNETFDVVNLLIAGGFGGNSFRFLAQPFVVGYVESLLKNSKDSIFREKAEIIPVGNFEIRPELFTDEALKKNLDGSDKEAQEHYVQAYVYFKSIAERYRQAVTVAQVDTKKYGKNPTELMSFLQNVDDYNSEYNLLFETPYNLFEQSFLKEKLNSVRTAMDMFGQVFLENSQLFKDASEKLCEIFNKKGSYSKKFLNRVVPKMKQSVFKYFFDNYIMNRFVNPDGQVNLHPLYNLFCDEKQSVIARYEHIQELCLKEGIGVDFFDYIKHRPIRKGDKRPKFFIVDSAVTNDQIVKQAVTDSIAELFHSTNPEVRQWITDVAVMQFYQTGGTDTSFGLAVRTSFYDALPVRELANIEATVDGKNITFNDYLSENPYQNNVDALVDQTILQLSISDDQYIKLYKTYRKADNFGLQLTGDKTVAVLKKFARNASVDKYGASYQKYIKIQTSRTETPSLYVLGNVALVTDEKTGKVYKNPIYFKVSTLGYQSYGNRSASIRTDGVWYKGKLISLFNTQMSARTDSGKYVAFTAKNMNELSSEFKLSGSNVPTKYSAYSEVETKLNRKARGVRIFDVDQLGNVLYDAANDPYFGLFDQNNPKNTNVVLERITQAPTTENVTFIERAKTLGAKFNQLTPNENDGVKMIGKNKDLSGTVSLIYQTEQGRTEAIDYIFNNHPDVTRIKYLSEEGLQFIDRNNKNATNQLLKSVEENKNSEEQRNKQC